MLTDTQVMVLVALNDHCDVHDSWVYDSTEPLNQQLSTEEPLTDKELGTALADLFELGLIKGFDAAEVDWPIRIDGLTAVGRQELP